MPPLNPDSFNDSYQVLLRNAEKLRAEDELDIDSLVPLVEESARAYQICKQRIEAVKKALEAHLAQPVGDDTATTPES